MVQSKRYVNADKGGFEFIMPEGIGEENTQIMKTHWEQSISTYKDLLANGVKKEDARAILPSNTSTKMNITGSLQSWWDFFRLRMNPRAQNEVRVVANEIFNQLSSKFPSVFNARSKAIFEGRIS